MTKKTTAKQDWKLDFLTPKYIVAVVAMIALIILEVSHASPTIIFVVACVTLIPLAAIIGQSTEMLAEHTGPKVGGFLNATLGNAAELIITLVALKAGYLELVKASITGSAIGNLLLVSGLAMFLGGVRHGVQKFDQQTAKHYATMLFSVVMLFSIPTIFIHTTHGAAKATINELSLGLAAGMFIVYGLGMYYSFTTASATPLSRPSAEHGHKLWSVQKSGVVLVASTVMVVGASEMLVGSIEHVLKSFPGISEFFLGFIIIPIVGNIAEHIVAVQVSYRKNNMTLAMEIAVGSSLQILLFVAPALVFASLLYSHQMDLVFNLFEWAALIGTCVIVSRVSDDGETNYFEGGILILLYLMVAWACYELPVMG
ncbi:MAG: calcium/proton exchanger [Nitrospinota bacterium]|nr:calcium/proton exchanger [Nitrospinota bacterium]